MKKILFLLALFTSTLSAMAQNELSKHLVTDFGQTFVTVSPSFEKCSGDGNKGNCATIALVKASIAQFKTLNNIFKEFKSVGDSLYFKFNDNIEASISRQDIDTVIKYSGIVDLSNSIYFDSAMIVYTAICKRVFVTKQLLLRGSGYNNPDCIITFRDAVDYISSGYPTATVNELLGFKMDILSISNIPSEPALIINDAAHAAFCSNGIQDISGRKFLVTGNRMENPRRNLLGVKTGKITGVYKLAK